MEKEMKAMVKVKSPVDQVLESIMVELTTYIDREIINEIFKKKYQIEDFDKFYLDREIEKWGNKIPFHTHDEMLDDRTYDAIARYFFGLGVQYAIQRIKMSNK